MASRKEKKEKCRKYLQENVNPILESLVVSILKEQPSDVLGFMIDWLQAEKDVPGSRKGSVTLGNKRDSDSEGEEDDEVEDLPVIAPMAKASIVGNQRKSVSAEAYGVFNKKADFKPRVIPKTVEQKKSIEKRLSQAFMFSALEEKDKQIVINAMEEKRFKKGDYVIRQYEDGDVLYIVDSGELDCYKQYKKGEEEKMVKNYFPGDSFGELALLYNAPRAATIKAKTDSLLWALDRECFNNIVKEAAVKKREKYEEMLKKVDILETMEAYEKSVIAEALQTVELKSGDRIIQEGDILTDFYFVEEGAVQKLNGSGSVIKEIKAGGYFGEEALLEDEPVKYSVELSSDKGKVAKLSKIGFKRLMGPVEAVIRQKIATV